MREPLRPFALAHLRPGAHLWIDRGAALYVTDDRDAGPALTDAGFTVTPRGALLTLTPTAALLPLLDAALPSAEPGDPLFAQLNRLAARPVRVEEIALLTRLLKARAPGGPRFPDGDKRLRQLAALALRGGGGGALALLTRLIHTAEEESR